MCARYTDFHVNEILPSGEVVHLTNLKPVKKSGQKELAHSPGPEERDPVGENAQESLFLQQKSAENDPTKVIPDHESPNDGGKALSKTEQPIKHEQLSEARDLNDLKEEGPTVGDRAGATITTQNPGANQTDTSVSDKNTRVGTLDQGQDAPNTESAATGPTEMDKAMRVEDNTTREHGSESASANEATKSAGSKPPEPTENSLFPTNLNGLQDPLAHHFMEPAPHMRRDDPRFSTQSGSEVLVRPDQSSSRQRFKVHMHFMDGVWKELTDNEEADFQVKKDRELAEKLANGGNQVVIKPGDVYDPENPAVPQANGVQSWNTFAGVKDDDRLVVSDQQRAFALSVLIDPSFQKRIYRL